MPTIAIVGAGPGPGLGLAIARKFGHEGFSVALISRTQDKLDRLATQLGDEGITAAGFTADVLDRPSLTAALQAATEHSGAIDVLEYSPADTAGGPLAHADIRDTTPENVQPQIEYYLYGGMTAVEAVLPAMRAAGTGTIIVTTGAGSVRPAPMFGNVAAGGAALRNWTLNLGTALDADDTGIHVAHVAIGVWVTDDKPADNHVPSLSPTEIAPCYWDLHTGRSTHEIVIER